MFQEIFLSFQPPALFYPSPCEQGEEQEMKNCLPDYHILLQLTTNIIKGTVDIILSVPSGVFDSQWCTLTLYLRKDEEDIVVLVLKLVNSENCFHSLRSIIRKSLL